MTNEFNTIEKRFNTIEALKAVLTEKKITFFEDENRFGDKMIGLKLGKHTIDWYDYSVFRNGESSFMFNQTYSQNTGSTKKGIFHGLNRRLALEKRIGGTIY